MLEVLSCGRGLRVGEDTEFFLFNNELHFFYTCKSIRCLISFVLVWVNCVVQDFVQFI